LATNVIKKYTTAHITRKIICFLVFFLIPTIYNNFKRRRYAYGLVSGQEAKLNPILNKLIQLK
jgi:hypothetical protein